MNADGKGDITLHRADVLQVLGDGAADLSGSFVSADKPVQVMAAHRCAAVPFGTLYCNKLEEAMLPNTALGKVHVIVPPMMESDPGIRRAQIIRIVAVEADALVTFTPEISTPLHLKMGQVFEVGPIDKAFVIGSTAPVQVAQYMLGREFDNNLTGPSMALVPAAERFRPDHWFHTTPGWAYTDIDVVAPAGAFVELDGVPLDAWESVEGSSWVVGHVRFASGDTELHSLVADAPIVAFVYSARTTEPDKAISYWRPTGYSLAPR